MHLGSFAVSGFVVKAGICAMSVGAIGWAFMATPITAAPAVAAAPSVPAAPLTPAVTALALVGINPETLAATGVNGEQASVIVAAAREHIAGTSSALLAAKAKVAAALQAQESAEAAVRGGSRTAQPQPSLTQARAATRAAQQAFRAAQESLRTAAMASLSDSQRQTIRVIIAAHAWDVPVQYKVVDRPANEWMALKSALLSRAVDSRKGEPQRPSSTSVIAAADSTPEVVKAAANLSANLAAVQAAFIASAAEK